MCETTYTTNAIHPITHTMVSKIFFSSILHYCDFLFLPKKKAYCTTKCIHTHPHTRTHLCTENSDLQIIRTVTKKNNCRYFPNSSCLVVFANLTSGATLVNKNNNISKPCVSSYRALCSSELRIFTFLEQCFHAAFSRLPGFAGFRYWPRWPCYQHTSERTNERTNGKKAGTRVHQPRARPVIITMCPPLSDSAGHQLFAPRMFVYILSAHVVSHRRFYW